MITTSASLQGGAGEEPLLSAGALPPSSPVYSFTESTPTHTEYTEGTPSFTTSSPSCSSDMLGMLFTLLLITSLTS